MIFVEFLLYLFLAIAVYLALIIFTPIVRSEAQPIEQIKYTHQKEPPQNRQSIEFQVDKSTVRGYLYLPEKFNSNLPCIIMSTGLNGTKDIILEKYALRFAKEGNAVITYDYRHYGESDGQPRQLYSANLQIEDLRAAVEFAKAHDAINTSKIVLWGTSAAGNYGIVVASKDATIAGVISQCATYDHKEDSRYFIQKYGYSLFIRLFVHAQRDKGRMRFGLTPHVIPAYGREWTTALINTDGAYDSINELAKGSDLFKNELCARSLLMPHPPDAIKASVDVKCKVQIFVCENDLLVSPNSYHHLEQFVGDLLETIKYPIGHFDLYEGTYFEKSIAEQIRFVKEV